MLPLLQTASRHIQPRSECSEHPALLCLARSASLHVPPSPHPRLALQAPGEPCHRPRSIFSLLDLSIPRAPGGNQPQGVETMSSPLLQEERTRPLRAHANPWDLWTCHPPWQWAFAHGTEDPETGPLSGGSCVSTRVLRRVGERGVGAQVEAGLTLGRGHEPRSGGGLQKWGRQRSGFPMEPPAGAKPADTVISAH